MTPREFTILMGAKTEQVYDEYERMATEAMMMRAAYHSNKLRQTDLFKRPKDGSQEERTAEDVKERQRAIMARLRGYEEFQNIS